MKYYTAQILTTTDGTESRDLRGFDTRDEALVRYYSMLAKYINAEGTKSILMMLFNETGGTEKSELWEAPESEE